MVNMAANKSAPSAATEPTVEPAEDPIAPPRDQVVGRVADEAGDEPKRARRLVDASRRGDGEESGIASLEQAPRRQLKVGNHDDRGKRGGGASAFGQDLCSDRSLERREAQPIMAVDPQQKLHEVIAQAADAVVENQMRHGVREVIKRPGVGWRA